MREFFSTSEPRIKTRARGVLRQILACVFLVSAVMMIWDGETRWWWIVIPISILPGLALWFVARLLLFAAGPLLRWRPLVR
jgi:hypothetical protein